jgi:hypothetical protein
LMNNYQLFFLRLRTNMDFQIDAIVMHVYL